MPNPTRGVAGEAAVLNAFIAGGFDVLLPFGDGQPYDLVIPIEPQYLRVQCKTAWPSGGCLLFNGYSTDHGHGQRSYRGRADIFGVYFPPTQAVYLVPVAEVTNEGRLRLEPARNGQRARIRLASDYEFDRWTPEALAHVAIEHQGLAAAA